MFAKLPDIMSIRRPAATGKLHRRPSTCSLLPVLALALTLAPVLILSGEALAQGRVVHIEDVEPLHEPPKVEANSFETEVYDSKSSAAPSMIWADTRLYMFYKDLDSGRVFYRFLPLEGGWTKAVNVPDCTTASAPAVTYWREYFFIVYKGLNTDRIYVNTMHIRSGHWTGPVKLINGRTSTQPTLEIRDDKLVVVYQGAKDNKLYWQALNYLPESALKSNY